MKRSIRTPMALFGLLLALAMVCTTSAQAPKPDAVPTLAPPAVGTPVAPKPDTPAVGIPVGVPTGTAKTEYIYQSAQPQTQPKSVHAVPLIVGRYQLVSHNGQLVMLDTATGECYTRNGSAWESLGPPIDPNATLPPTPTDYPAALPATASPTM